MFAMLLPGTAWAAADSGSSLREVASEYATNSPNSTQHKSNAPRCSIYIVRVWRSYLAERGATLAQDQYSRLRKLARFGFSAM